MLPVTIVLSLFALSLASSAPNVAKEWSDFQAKYNKSYSPAEAVKRYAIFAEQLNDIFTHNLKFQQGLVTFWKKINIFSDLSPTEFLQKVLMRFNRTSVARAQGEQHVLSNETLPDSLDWRDQGYVTPVKNQQSCGACWAFSAIGALEGQKFRNTGVLTVLSEQDLIDCSTTAGNLGCEGGYMENAFQYAIDNGGVSTNASYPYESKNGVCRSDKAEKGVTIRSFRQIAVDETLVTDALATEGPISCPFYVGTGGFPQNYGGGIYVNPNCQDQLNHGVVLVGYGTDAQAGAYYIVKNSWGADWGEDGYFRIARGNTCGLLEGCSYPLV